MTNMRLSRKAQEEVGKLTAAIDESVRKVAAAFAATQGREFADEQDVTKAYRSLILEIASDFHKKDPTEPLHLQDQAPKNDAALENDELRKVIDDLRSFIGDTFYANVPSDKKPLPNSWYKGTSKVYGDVLDEIMARVSRKTEKRICEACNPPGGILARCDRPACDCACHRDRKDVKNMRYGWSSDPQTDAELQAKYGDSVHRPKHEGE